MFVIVHFSFYGFRSSFLREIGPDVAPGEAADRMARTTAELHEVIPAAAPPTWPSWMFRSLRPYARRDEFILRDHQRVFTTECTEHTEGQRRKAIG
jgi:hypothetical protein